jgi:hypothetical protein
LLFIPAILSMMALIFPGCGGSSGGNPTSSAASWKVVGSGGFSAGEADYISIAVDGSGVPYVAYQDVTNGKATVMKFAP